VSGFFRHAELRYGENPHQRAALYLEAGAQSGAALGEKLQGKELSYNNYLDLDAAYRAVYGQKAHACAIIKHTNPCGLAVAETQTEAFLRALAGDPISAFGSVLGLNQPLSEKTAQAIIDSRLFVECIIAPGFDEGARARFADRQNLRLVVAPPGDPAPQLHFHRIGGGLLVQDCDPGLGDPSEWRVVSRRGLSPGDLDELVFAMHAAMLCKSNAITVTRDKMLLGAGAGHMSRIDAAEQAIKKAGERARGGFMGSDAFFPFPDCIKLAAAAGIAAVVQPGGSLRDADSIAAADEHDLVLVFTGRRHFRH
jgi:phosphoribosylaminoimidazolecarboxamide formyltransferase/IMP cyclohydrolase